MSLWVASPWRCGRGGLLGVEGSCDGSIWVGGWKSMYVVTAVSMSVGGLFEVILGPCELCVLILSSDGGNAIGGCLRDRGP